MENKLEFSVLHQRYIENGVQSFTDLPGNYFWEEFYTMSPNAKVWIRSIGSINSRPYYVCILGLMLYWALYLIFSI